MTEVNPRQSLVSEVSVDQKKGNKRFRLSKKRVLIILLFIAISFIVFSIFTSTKSAIPVKLFDLTDKYEVNPYSLDMNGHKIQGFADSYSEIRFWQSGGVGFYLGCASAPQGTRDFPKCDIYQHDDLSNVSVRSRIGSVLRAPRVYKTQEGMYVVFRLAANAPFREKLFKVTDSDIVEVKGLSKDLGEVDMFGNERAWYAVTRKDVSDFVYMFQSYQIIDDQAVPLNFPAKKAVVLRPFDFNTDSRGNDWYLIYTLSGEMIYNIRLYEVDKLDVLRVWKTGKYERCFFYWDGKVGCSDKWNTWRETIPGFFGLRK